MVSWVLWAGPAFYSPQRLPCACCEPSHTLALEVGVKKGHTQSPPQLLTQWRNLAGVRPWVPWDLTVPVCLPEALREFGAQLWFQQAWVWILAPGWPSPWQARKASLRAGFKEGLVCCPGVCGGAKPLSSTC